MLGNFHPILVHFPIALLTIYAIFECIRFKKVIERPYWFFIKATLVILGELGALAAYVTGHGQRGSVLIHIHNQFAIFTVWIFAIISLSYLLEWFKPSKYSNFMMKPIIIIPLAFIGLLAVVITGGLGGAIVYGTQFDPFMAPIFKLLGVY